MKKLAKTKITKLLKEVFETYGIKINSSIIPKLGEYVAENYNKEKVTDVQDDDCLLFNSILRQQRIAANKFSHVKQIKKGTSQYKQVIKIVESANKFSMLYSIDNKHIGYHDYIRVGLKLMGKNYGINKFGYFDEQIFQLREFEREISCDIDKVGTEEIQKIWDRCIEIEFGFTRHTPISISQHKEYVNFVWAREFADENKAGYKDWVMGQIESLKFIGSPPHLTCLHGEKAVIRYTKYLGQLGSNVTKNKSFKNVKEQSQHNAIINRLKNRKK